VILFHSWLNKQYYTDTREDDAAAVVESCRVYSYTVFSFLGALLVVGDTEKRSENHSELGQYTLTTTTTTTKTTTKKGKNSGQLAEQ